MSDELMGRLGMQKLREAGQWWLTFDFAVHNYRCWAVLWTLRSHLRARLASRGFGKTPLQVEQLAEIDRQINEAHDRLLIETENLFSAARAAASCEMASRIYYEEYEGLETHRLQEQDDDRE